MPSIFLRFAVFALILGLTVLVLPRGALVLGPDGATRAKANYDEFLFQSGDVVFRRGVGLLSRAVLAADPESGYSHTGLIRQSLDETWVIHATPGESPTSETTIRTETLNDFLGPYSAAVFRPAHGFEEVSERASDIAHGYFLEARKFDPRFDLATEDELYCTELVWRAYLEAGLDLSGGELDDVRFPMFQKRCLLPSRLLKSPYLRLVYELNGKEP